MKHKGAYCETTACNPLGGFGTCEPPELEYSNAPMSQFPVGGRLTPSWSRPRAVMPRTDKLVPVWYAADDVLLSWYSGEFEKLRFGFPPTLQPEPQADARP